MNPAQVLDYFDRISDAPDAIPRLRRFILDLAVRGKLVEQDPRDEPASELLKRIQEEKNRLMKMGEVRKEKPLPLVDQDEAPFGAPAGWEWVRTRQVTSDRGQTTPKNDFTYIDVTAINKEVGCIGDAKVVSASDAPSRARKLVQTGDVIYSCVRPYLLNIAVMESDIVPPPIASTAFAVLNGFGLVLSRYLWVALRSPFMVECVESKMRGQAYPAINDSDFALLPLPLPPLAEQQRIVTKVNELMALCNRMEAAQAERENRRDRLAAASLNNLIQPADAPSVFQDHARFYFNHLPRLTTSTEHIKLLRQTILNLAVLGKLVPQDPNGESAEELAEPPAKKSAPQKDDRDAPFELPTNWQWMQLGRVSELINGDRSKNYPNKAEYVREGVAWINTGHIEPDGTLSTNSMHYITRKKFDSLRSGKVRPGDLVYCLRGATLGKTAIITQFDEGAVASSLVIVRLSPAVDPRFAYQVLTSPLGRDQIFQFDNGSAQPNLSANNVKKYWIPIPPLAEQHRIVAKVDELMALCDQLEAQLTTTQTESRRLLEAVLHEALVLAV